MSEHAKAKAMKFTALLDEVTALTVEMETDAAKNDTPENREKLTALLTEGEALRKSIEQDNQILGFKSFLQDPVGTPVGGDGAFSQGFTNIKSIGEQFVESEGYKAAIKSGKAEPGLKLALEAKGFVFPSNQKATFTTTSTGLMSGLQYAPGMVMVEQQRLTIRDLLSVGETTLNSVPYIKETSFTNAADMVGEEGEKPEATLVTQDETAPVKKIAVVIKVSDEVFADFPMMRDYVNGRLRFMVLAKEEQQLLNGTGVGNQITGILNSSPQTTSATTPGELDAILEAITKIRRTDLGGGYEPDGIAINPVDWLGIRKLKDAVNGQYYGGGPFYAPYGSGPFIQEPMIWGLRPVITTAMAAGTALVGAFKLGAQIWQREGVRVEAFDQNEDDVNFNRITVRVEERLALAVYRPKAFCTVTDIAF